MEWVFFDLDGTLLDHEFPEKEAIRQFACCYSGTLGNSHEKVLGVWRSISAKNRALYEKGEVSFDGQRVMRMKGLFEFFGKDISDGDAKIKFLEYQSLYEKSLRLFPDVPMCLFGLSALKLGVITNGKTLMQTRKLKETGILSYFSVLVIAEDAGFTKPDRRIFEFACRKAGCKPGNAVYVGDRFDIDAEAGRKAGLQAVWLNRNNAAVDPKGIRQIQSLEQLAQITMEIENKECSIAGNNKIR
jgi:putative hydrolase of the HAD superfamily